MAEKIRELREEVGREFGLLSRAAARLLGHLVLWSTRREARRLAAGHTYEPATIIERRNWMAPPQKESAAPALEPLPAE